MNTPHINNIKKTLMIEDTIIEERVESEELIDSDGLDLEDDDIEINSGDNDSIIEVGKTLI